MIVPGWLMALPLAIGMTVAFFCIFRFVKSDTRRALWLLATMAGVLVYYAAASPFEIVDDDSQPTVVWGDEATV